MTVCAKFDCPNDVAPNLNGGRKRLYCSDRCSQGCAAMAAYVEGMAMGRTALPVVLGVVFHPHAGETVLHQTMPASGVLP